MSNSFDTSFMAERQRAVERMKEMSGRAIKQDENQKTMPPVPSFVNVNNRTASENRGNGEIQKNKEPKNNILDGILGDVNLPFTQKLLSDPDMSLILGLLLILASEGSDKLMLSALLYILI